MIRRWRELLLVMLAAAALYLGAHRSAWPPSALAPTDQLGRFRPFPALEVPAVKNHLLLDPLLQFIPWLEHSRGELLEGRLPTWNPLQGLGSVHLGNDQSAVFSLWSLPYYALGAHGLLLAGLLQALSLCLGIYLWLRDERLSRRAALAAGLALSACGPVVAWQLHHHVGAFAWIGLALFLCGRVARAERLISGESLALAVVTAQTVFAGHVQSALMVALAALAWGGLLARRAAEAGGARAGGRVAGRLLVVALLGLGLSAIHWLPFAEALSRSEAWAERAGGAGSVQVPWKLFSLTLFPDLFGSPRDGWLSPSFGGPSYLEQAGAYVSGALLALALAGILVGYRRRARLVSLAWAGAAFCVLAVYGPLSGLLHHVPPFGWTRNHRLTFLLALCLVVLAARGLDLLLKGRRSENQAALVVVGAAALVALVLALLAPPPPGSVWPGPLGRFARGHLLATLLPAAGALAALALVAYAPRLGDRWVGALLGGVLAVELLVFAWDFAPGAPPASLRPPLPRLEAHAGERFLAVGANVIPPNLGTTYGLREVRHYDALGEATVRARLDRLATFIGPLNGVLGRFDDEEADALSVGLVLTDDPQLAQNLQRGLSGWLLETSQPRGGPRAELTGAGLVQTFPAPTAPLAAIVLPEVACAQPTVLRFILSQAGAPALSGSVELPAGGGDAVLRFPPRAFDGALALALTSSPPGAQVLVSAGDVLRPGTLRRGTQDLPGDLTFLLAGPVSTPYQAVTRWPGAALLRNPDALPRARVEGTRGSVETLKDGASEVVLEVRADAGGTLVLADAYVPGWEATVDGAPAPVRNLDGLRAVDLPTGRHRVVLTYRPWSVRWGGGLTLLCLALWGVLASRKLALH